MERRYTLSQTSLQMDFLLGHNLLETTYEATKINLDGTFVDPSDIWSKFEMRFSYLFSNAQFIG